MNWKSQWPRFVILAATVVLLLTATGKDDGGKLKVESSRELDVAAFNAEIAAAAAAGEPWVADVVLVAHRYLSVAEPGAGVDLWFSIKPDRPEGPTTHRVEAVRDQLLDDSIGADWTSLRLERQADGSWTVAEARRAWRCRRGDSTDAFTSEPCP